MLCCACACGQPPYDSYADLNAKIVIVTGNQLSEHEWSDRSRARATTCTPLRAVDSNRGCTMSRSRAFALAAAVLAVAVAARGHMQLAGARDDACPEQCSLNGRCSSSSASQSPHCVCDHGWRGQACQQLDLRDTVGQLHGSNGSCRWWCPAALPACRELATDPPRDLRD